MEEKVKQVSPWVAYAYMIRAMFQEDPDVHFVYDDETCTVKLRVDDQTKAEALARLLPETVVLGNAVLRICVIPANVLKVSTEELFREAFKGNRAVSDFVQIRDTFTNPLTYMVFKKAVVQYWTDNLGDPHGNRSTLYQEIAEEIFREHNGVLFCTDNKED